MSITRSMLLEPLDALAGGASCAAAPCSREVACAEQGVDDQRRLARAGDTGDAGEAGRAGCWRDMLQVVAASRRGCGSAAPDRAACAAAAARCGAGRSKILTGERARIGFDLGGRALRDDLAAVRRRRRDPGRRRDRPRRMASSSCSTTMTVLPMSRRRCQRREQAPVVALVQPDRGLIQHVHDAGEAGADLACQADALRFAAGERLGAAVERQIVKADVDAGSAAARARPWRSSRRPRRASPACRDARRSPALADREMRDLRAGCCPATNTSARSAFRRAPPQSGQGRMPRYLRELFAHRRRLGLPIAPLEIRAGCPRRHGACAACGRALLVAEFDDLIAAAVQQHVLHVRWQLGPGRLDVEVVVPRERLDELEVVGVAPVPAAHRAARERQVRMHHDALADRRTPARPGRRRSGRRRRGC